MHELEKEIALKYIEKGAILTRADLFIPIIIAEEFILGCSLKGIALIGLDLFEIINEKIKPLIEYVDNSEYLRMYRNWEDIVNACKDRCLRFIDTIKRDQRDLSFLYVNPVFEFIFEWETSKQNQY